MKTLLQASLILGLAGTPAAAGDLTVLTAGDQNMVDYINDYLGPLFEKENPGDDGSRRWHRPRGRRIAEDRRAVRCTGKGQCRQMGR